MQKTIYQQSGTKGSLGAEGRDKARRMKGRASVPGAECPLLPWLRKTSGPFCLVPPRSGCKVSPPLMKVQVSVQVLTISRAKTVHCPQAMGQAWRGPSIACGHWVLSGWKTHGLSHEWMSLTQQEPGSGLLPSSFLILRKEALRSYFLGLRYSHSFYWSWHPGPSVGIGLYCGTLALQHLCTLRGFTLGLPSCLAMASSLPPSSMVIPNLSQALHCWPRVMPWSWVCFLF